MVMTARRTAFAGIAAAALGAAFFMRVAQAQDPGQVRPPCADRGRVVEGLREDFGEVPVGMGMTAGGAVVELYVSADRSTWTAVVSLPNGQTCVIAAGEAWRDRPSPRQLPAGKGRSL